MDKTVMLLLQALCAVALLSGSVAGLRCYHCSSDQDPRCADPIDKTMLPIQCTMQVVRDTDRHLANLLGSYANLGIDVFGGKYSQLGGGETHLACQKIEVYVTNPLGRRTNTTLRGCAAFPEAGPEEHCGHVNQRMQSADVLTTFCGGCEADGCNGATGLSVTVFALVPVVLAVLLAGRQ